ncbi:MAG: SpoIIE family protein phosphatase [Proteobacteria bacterium]|nr:SpoIIE family protein phosphatase [Pseudomonadota bacterium]
MSTLPPLVVPADLSSLTIIAEYVISAGKAAGLERHTQYRLRLAVDEVATNIVLHGYQALGEAGSLTVAADIGQDVLTICIEDTARAYDPRNALDEGIGAVSLDERREGGLGLFLASRSVDEFDYEHRGGKNRNIFRVHLSPDRVRGGDGLRARLLIVVSPSARAVLEAVLKSASHDITWAEDSHQIRQMLHFGRFDVLFLGLDLPGQLGEVCLRDLRADHDITIPPVVLVYESESESETRLERCLGPDIADILALQGSEGLIYARVGRIVGRTRLKSELAALQSRNTELEALAHDFTEVVLPLGIALSKEQSQERLMERIVVEAMKLCHADAGTLYLRGPDNTLRFAVMRTNSKGLVFGGTSGRTAPYPSLQIRDAETGRYNYRNITTCAVIERRSINVPDIYHPKIGFDVSRAREFDRVLGYRTISCLTVPLATNGDAVGALQLLNAQDPETGQVVPFNPYQERVAESLASQATISLYNQTLIGQRAQLMRLEQEMHIGRDIQANFLPGQLPRIPDWQLAASVHPARLVSGDFYDAFHLGDGCYGLVIADVCDKGVGAAIFMGLIRSLLRAFAQIDWIAEHATQRAPRPDSPAERANFAPCRQPSWATQPAPHDTRDDSGAGDESARPEVSTEAGPVDEPIAAEALLWRLEIALRRSVCLTNDYVAHTHRELDMFATLFFGALVPESGRMLYINCGHPPLFLCNRDGVRKHLEATGPAVGIIPGAEFGVAQVVIEKGELVVGYTDGVIDARDSQGQHFGQKRLLSLLSDPPPGAVEALEAVDEQLRAHTDGVDQFDDYSLLTVFRQPGQ